MGKYTCHVCGYSDLDEAPWEGNIPTHNICDCCGVEFGYEDCKEENVEKFRCKWINNGCIWFNKELKPDDWDYEKQLENINYKIKKNGTTK
ncbi:hypothetical protein [Oceanirhabdus sp. W0125-5]|uniref:hypothetical protein n=1 Tax=Oceanirhabdus sp. W0125-5 TaxID=2999116 RepID=UPI0022F32CD5|nr:hypothetical protein [Oceanirhabdus sp. W0125-5]WBW98367.1 hypothetical protein OW730_06255 [Oceanirhabdus sp. W0125-5]